MTGRIEAILKVGVHAPFLFPGIAAGRFGFDRVALRDHKGRIIVPQDQVKGLLRHGLKRVGRGDLVSDLFGEASGDANEASASDFSPERRSRVFFTDLRANKAPDSSVSPYHRVEIDDVSGAAREGHLVRLEQVFEPEEKVDFQGRVTVFTERDVGEILGAFRDALTSYIGIGSHTSIGFGILRRVELDADEPEGVASPPSAVGAHRYILWIGMEK